MQKENKRLTKYNTDIGQIAEITNKSEDNVLSSLTASLSITRKIKKVTVMPMRYTNKNCIP